MPVCKNGISTDTPGTLCITYHPKLYYEAISNFVKRVLTLTVLRCPLFIGMYPSTILEKTQVAPSTILVLRSGSTDNICPVRQALPGVDSRAPGLAWSGLARPTIFHVMDSGPTPPGPARPINFSKPSAQPGPARTIGPWQAL